MQYNSTPHQKKQIEVIRSIDKQTRNNSISFTTVSPVDDYAHDTRIALTSAHIPSQTFKQKVRKKILLPLQSQFPEHYYFSPSQLHMTIKGIRVAADPPTFTDFDVKLAINVFSKLIPMHESIRVYFYTSITFPSNLSLIGTTDPELDELIFDLDSGLSSVGLEDDKKYANSSHFFCNLTLARFRKKVSQRMKDQVQILVSDMKLEPYEIDSLTLLSCNPSFKRRKNYGTWRLKGKS